MSNRPFSISLKILVRNTDGKYLLIKRSSGSSWNPGKWELPGGKMDSGEIMEESLLREVFEETGLNVKINTLFDAVRDDTTDFKIIHVIMTGEVLSGDIDLSHEHDDYQWLEPVQINNFELCDYLLRLDYGELN